MKDHEFRELDDDGLAEIFGNRYQDVTAAAQERKKRVTAKPIPADRGERKPVGEAAEAKWEPVEQKPGWMDKLKACAFGALTFGGLAMLLFCWEQAGLMDASVAVPSMCVCTGLAGMSVGKAVRSDR